MLKVRNKFADGMNEEDRGTRANEGTDAGERADDEESAARRESCNGSVFRARAQERFFLQSRVRLRPRPDGQKIERTDLDGRRTQAR